ncbi:APC family permease [Apilactobacillus ozensis]|uniref:APC family permease n=1 Tax=Apilactobacillus ozensis TaxID=866801 RepID=UPI00200B0B1E|nr:APC family permease [Apilactobacillus ozensis]MCK8606722.1 APC family permease [Apilactobacillus ozensis]
MKNTNKTKKKMGLFQIVMLGLSSIIGSGWLFGSWEASRVAGPAAIISWVVGAIVIGAIAFNYIELGSMFPESGGMSKYAQYSHGSLLGFIAAWANWVSLVTLIPIEAVAAVQYMNTWPWKWASWTHGFMEKGEISNQGLLVVFLFILVFTLLNYWSVNLLARFTSVISILKLGVPMLTIIMLLLSGFHSGNFTSVGGFMPYGSAAIFSATTASGIIFSYNAFQVVINMGQEIKNPKKNISRGIVISLGISIVIYVLLQFTFIGSVIPADLANGWHGVDFESPFADLAILLGIHWLAILLYLDAFVSPFGTGVSFVAQTARTLAAMKDNGHMPKFLGIINERWGVPRIAMVVNMIVSVLLVAIFRSWGTLASVISTSTLIAYLTGPVTVKSLRKMAPNFKRPIRIKLLEFMAPFAFVLASLATYWAMWPTTIKVIGVILLGLPFYFYFEWKTNWNKTGNQFKGSLWMIGYLIFISIISYLGSSDFGGINLIPYPFDFVVIIIVSLICYYWGISSYVVTKNLDNAKAVNDKVQMK